MLHLPKEFIHRMKLQLGDEADAFFNALEEPSPTSIRLHHLKGHSSFEKLEPVPWCENGYYLESRPYFHLDPHWHGGAYYVQEASSMILDHVLSQLIPGDQSRIWLDLCAAPGGKTGILAKHLGLSDVLIANEVVSQRRSILRENLTKAGFINTFITGEPSSSFSEPLADIILIDAPCAGEGMMRKEPEAINQWTPSLVDSCAALQKQIVREAARSLQPNGILIYSTCSYSMDENIDNIDHFIHHHELEPVPLHFPLEWNIVDIRKDSAIGYQLYPHRVKGEGLFISVLKKSDLPKPGTARSKKDKIEFETLPDWLSAHVSHPTSYLKRKQSIENEFISKATLEKATEVLTRLPGAELISRAGELKGKDFIPAHFMAMAGIHDDSYEVIELDLNDSLGYLERNTQHLPSGKKPGWYLMGYNHTILGWSKSTLQGWKNYYPMPWRLRDRRTK